MYEYSQTECGPPLRAIERITNERTNLASHAVVYSTCSSSSNEGGVRPSMAVGRQKKGTEEGRKGGNQEEGESERGNEGERRPITCINRFSVLSVCLSHTRARALRKIVRVARAEAPHLKIYVVA